MPRRSPDAYGYGTGRIHPVDAHVGRRLRERRHLQGLSQQQIADMVGLTFQQVQKYENGTNRVSGSRLYDFACVLDVPVGYFFEGLPGLPEAASVGEDVTLKREALELARAFHKIRDRRQRRRLIALAEGVAGIDR